MASVVLTYILWLTLGWLGIHHLYLRRPHHALTWFITLGGVCGLGWIRDFWRIPDYVARTNCDKRHNVQLLHVMGGSRSASCGTLRCSGMVVVGLLGGIVFCGLVPGYSYRDALLWCATCRVASILLNMAGSALGIYLVANIGELRCSLFYPAAGSVLALPWLWGQSTNNVMPVITASFVTWWQGFRWRPLPHPNNKIPVKTCLKFYFTGAFIWMAILSSGIYFNAKITTSRGETVLVREKLLEFFQGVDWGFVRDGISSAFQGFSYSFRSYSWEDAFERSHGAFTESSSLRVLGLDGSAGEKEVARMCRELSRKYHPDLQKTEWEKDAAQAKFIKVQEACSIAKKATER